MVCQKHLAYTTKVFPSSLQWLTIKSSSLTPIPTPILFLFTFGDLNLFHSGFLLHQLEGIFFHRLMIGIKISEAYQCLWCRKHVLVSPLMWSLKKILTLANSHLGRLSLINLPLQRQLCVLSKNCLTSYFSSTFSVSLSLFSFHCYSNHIITKIKCNYWKKN